MSDSNCEWMTKYEYVENLNHADFGRTNFVNTAEEETLLEYVESFRRQFIQLFPTRHESLYLSPLNEFGIRKFVCCSIRPTLQRFVHLWNYQEATQFVASFLTYDTLTEPTQAPDLSVSNHILLNTRRGDSLDYCNLLCSLLRGSGYNAFVVFGVAVKCVTQNDQTHNKISNEILESTKWNGINQDENEINNESANNEVNQFEIPSFYQTQENKKPADNTAKHKTYKQYLVEKESALLSKKESELSQLKSTQEKETIDPLRNKRVHFWVLIKRGLRDVVDRDFFIEPVSGKIYEIKDDNLPFIRIESIWNDANYWVNVQNDTKIQNMSFDLNDTKCFEFILFDDKHLENDKANKSQKEVLTLPSSWQKPFFFTQKHIDNVYPEEGIIINYDQAKLERFNRFHNKDGLTMKVTLFKDENINEIRQIYNDRHDLLIKRITKLENKTTTLELFDTGRVSGLFQLINDPQKRITVFYPNSRTDGMIKRVEIFGETVTEIFNDRNNGIVRRVIYLVKIDKENSLHAHVQFAGDANLEYGLQKVEEFYNKKSVENIRLLTFDIVNNEYIINYHFGDHRILAKNTIFNKKTGSVQGWNPDPMKKNPNTAQLKQQFENLILKEKNLLTQIRERERSFAMLLSKINEEREVNNLELVKDPYTVAKEIVDMKQNSEEIDVERSDTININKNKENTDESDEYSMLDSFLPKNKDMRLLNKEQMDQIKEDCLRSLKERLVQRLNILTKRLHSEVEKLENIKVEYENWQNNDVDHGGDVNFKYNENQQLLNERKESIYKKEKKEIEFKINIIKQRLSTHEMQSIQKMNQLAHLLDTHHTRSMISNVI